MSVKVKKSYNKVELLSFIWKWKVVSTNIMYHKFYNHCSLYTVSRHLSRLKQSGLIKTIHLPLADKKVWSLTKKGFLLIKNYLGELEEDGFASEYPEHDYWASAFQLGEWLINKPEKSDFFSEQELRRYHKDLYPNWVPSSDRHQADGYWLVPTEEKPIIVALELELSRKTQERIKSTARFYGGQDLISRVIWVIPKSRNITTFQNTINESGAQYTEIHNFVWLEDFQQKAWQATFIHGLEKGITVQGFMKNPMSKTSAKPLTISSMVNFNDLRLFPTKSTRSKPQQKSK